VQQQTEDLAKEGREDVTLGEIQKILYSTEVRRYQNTLVIISFIDLLCMIHQDGFEVPESGAAAGDEEETF
jgi:hypothetical protein